MSENEETNEENVLNSRSGQEQDFESEPELEPQYYDENEPQYEIEEDQEAPLLSEDHSNNQYPTQNRRKTLDIRTLNDTDIEDDDIEVNYKDGKLDDFELLSYIGAFFSNETARFDYEDDVPSTTPELNRNGYRVTWVENKQTGEFNPVSHTISAKNKKLKLPNLPDFIEKRRKGLNTKNIWKPVDLKDLDDAYEGKIWENKEIILPNPLISEKSKSGLKRYKEKEKRENKINALSTARGHYNLLMLQRGVFLIFQGLFAGFCFTTFYTSVASGGSDALLLEFYQPIAGNTRRYMYLLAILSVVGSLDVLLTVIQVRTDLVEQKTKKSVQHNQKFLFSSSLRYNRSKVLFTAIFIFLLHFIAFFLTLLMSPMDTLIATRNGIDQLSDDEINLDGKSLLNEEDSLWITLALEDNDFSNGLNQWRDLDVGRLVCAILAWIGCALFIWRDLTQLNRQALELHKVGESAYAWLTRAKLMEGENTQLQRLKTNELRKLASILQRGLDRTIRALNISELENEQHEL